MSAYVETQLDTFDLEMKAFAAELVDYLEKAVLTFKETADS
jgi:hypothetical protein